MHFHGCLQSTQVGESDMNAKYTDARYQTAQDLAGPQYQLMMSNKDAALEYLTTADHAVRLAAIMVCEVTWKCGCDPRVLEACRELAVSDADAPIRFCAIDVFGRGLSGSKSPAASGFLADIIVRPATSNELRLCAYWALREVQFGASDESFDQFLKGTMSAIKSILRTHPERSSREFLKRCSEEKTREAIAPHDCFPEGFWESAEEIDWDFVARFATRA